MMRYVHGADFSLFSMAKYYWNIQESITSSIDLKKEVLPWQKEKIIAVFPKEKW